MHPVLLFNTTIMGALPAPGETFAYALQALTADEARAIVAEATTEGGPGVESFVGHAATCAAMSTILGCPVPENRALSAQAEGQRAIALKVRGRIPEGTVLDEAALETIGYDLYLITRTGWRKTEEVLPPVWEEVLVSDRQQTRGGWRWNGAAWDDGDGTCTRGEWPYWQPLSTIPRS